MKKKAFLIPGILSLLVSFAMLLFLSLPTLGGQDVVFPSVYKQTPVTLKGTYWQGSGDYAVLICPGYSCDRQKWRPFADMLVSEGCSVMTFDYSGQGASSGTIGFDNAKTDAIPVQIDAALQQLHRISGVPYENIILLGHSMGGRAILRLMYDYNAPEAQTTVSPKPIGNAILLSPEVNYHFNAQASLFAGTSDADEEPWRSYRDACAAGTNLYLFGSTADDIVADEDVLSIFARLGGIAPESGVCEAVTVTENGRRTVRIGSGVLHSYMMYSPKFVRFTAEALAEITGAEARYPAGRISLVYAGWFLGLVGLYLTLRALTEEKTVTDTVPTLTDAGKFLRRKLLMWLPGTAAAFAVCCLCVVMPFGSPVMNTPYMCFIAGYGMVMAFAYRRGKFPGTAGTLPKPRLRITGSRREVVTALLAAAALCFFLWFALRATMYRLIPLNARLFWVAAASVLMAIGYYVSGCEEDMLSCASWRVRLAYSLIQYIPLFLLVGFYLALKSYSGMIGQVQNMLLMYIFCVPMGSFLRRRTGSRIWGAVVSAFLFQTLMITSAALIALF